MAVLFRTRFANKKFEKKFKELNIPKLNSSPSWRINEGQNEIAKDIASYISLAINEFDNWSFERVINKPRRGLGCKAVKTINQVSQKLDGAWYANVPILTIQHNRFVQQSASRIRCSALLEASRRLASTGGGGLSAKQIGELRQFLKAVDGLKSDLDSMEAKDVIKQVDPTSLTFVPTIVSNVNPDLGSSPHYPLITPNFTNFPPPLDHSLNPYLKSDARGAFTINASA